MSPDAETKISLFESWKPLGARGAVSVLFGVAAMLIPALTLRALVLIFGGYLVADGLLIFSAGVRARRRETLWMFEGVISAFVGIVALLWTNTATSFLLGMVGAWAIFTGLLELSAAVRLRRLIAGEIFLGLAGAVSLFLGTWILVWPTVGAMALIRLLGLYALFFGIMMMTLAFRLRQLVPAPPVFRDDLQRRPAI